MIKQKNSKIKIGSRILDLPALSKLLPQYKQIEKEINHMRENATVYQDKYLDKKRHDLSAILKQEYQKNTSNVISILGERGSGKTSVLLTIKHRLDQGTYDMAIEQENSSIDIVMPTILPETMESNSDLLGWILGSFRLLVDQLDHELLQEENDLNYEERYSSCRKTSTTPLRQSYNNVIRQYRYTKPDYQKVILQNYDSFAGYLDDTKNILDPQNQLIHEFHTFIETVVSLKRANQEGAKVEPLVFFFIDDVDLSNERCEEVLNVINRYLTHPNIVTFVAGSPSQFQDVLLLNHLNHMNITELLTQSYGENPYQQNILSHYEKLVEDTMKKILPPSLRFPLEPYNYVQRLYFSYDDQPSLRELIEKCFEFTKDEWYISNIYGVIFDAYPRGLMNVYYELSVLCQKEPTKLDLEKARTQKKLSRLIQVMLRTTDVLMKYEKEILRCIDINESQLEIRIDYLRAKAIIPLHEMEPSQKEQKCRELMRIYTFFNFLENIIEAVKKKDGKGYKSYLKGGEEIYSCIQTQIGEKEFHLLPKLNDVNLELELYYRFVENSAYQPLINLKDFDHYNEAFRVYFIGLQNACQSVKLDMSTLISIAARSDIHWSRMICKIISHNCNPILTTIWEKMEVCIAELENVHIPDEMLCDIDTEIHEFLFIHSESIETVVALNKNMLEGKEKVLEQLYSLIQNGVTWCDSVLEDIGRTGIDTSIFKTESICEETYESYQALISEYFTRIRNSISSEYGMIYLIDDDIRNSVSLLCKYLVDPIPAIAFILQNDYITAKSYDTIVAELEAGIHKMRFGENSEVQKAMKYLKEQVPYIILNSGNEVKYGTLNKEILTQLKDIDSTKKVAEVCLLYILLNTIEELRYGDLGYYAFFQTLDANLSEECIFYKQYKNDNSLI